MKRTDIRFGRKYLIRGSHRRGPAEVLGPERRSSPLSSHLEFLVRFPMALANQREEAWVPTRDFIHRWSEDDQRRFEESRRLDAQIEAIKTGLLAAGFGPDQVMEIHGDLRIFFRGDVAARVVEILLEHAGQPKRALEIPMHQIGPGS